VVEQLKSAPERLLQAPEYAIRYLLPHRNVSSAFGDDWFGQVAERLARFFGTPKYIAAQTMIVILWVIFNGYSILVHFDKYPFILLNLAFSTQAAYAAPLILLAQTRQADRDKVHAEADAHHREELAQMAIQKQEATERHAAHLQELIEQNTVLTEETRAMASRIDELTAELHQIICKQSR
jgi:uncharacterized membrane protein